MNIRNSFLEILGEFWEYYPSARLSLLTSLWKILIGFRHPLLPKPFQFFWSLRTVGANLKFQVPDSTASLFRRAVTVFCIRKQSLKKYNGFCWLHYWNYMELNHFSGLDWNSLAEISRKNIFFCNTVVLYIVIWAVVWCAAQFCGFWNEIQPSPWF